MPRLNGPQLTDVILDAFAQSGLVAYVVPRSPRYPLQFTIVRDEQPIDAWIYIWTLTHGGRPSLPDEYRIQMTGVDPPFLKNPDGITALMGFEPNLGMFAGLDLERHTRFIRGSTSVQIDIRSVHQALADGLAFDLKDNGELAIGVRPDAIAAYLFDAQGLHASGSNGAAVSLLQRASTRAAVSSRRLQALPQPRRRIVVQVSRFARAANFRRQVLQAYDNRCAVTRTQMKLVDAAHILPVEAGDESRDEVRNGVALSPTIHRAYDRGLIYLDEDYAFNLNEVLAAQLRETGYAGGLEALESGLGRMHLPPDRRQWPDIQNIRRGNQIRNIPV